MVDLNFSHNISDKYQKRQLKVWKKDGLTRITGILKYSPKMVLKPLWIFLTCNMNGKGLSIMSIMTKISKVPQIRLIS